MSSRTQNDLQHALRRCRPALLWVGGFSLFINLLMLTPALYMLQVYDRVIASGSKETLLMLTLVTLFLLAVMVGLEWVRSRLLVRVGNHLDAQVSGHLYRAMFRRGLSSPGEGSGQPLDDLRTVRQFLSGQGLFAFFDAPWVPIYLAILFLFNVWFGVFATGAGLLLLGLAIINEKVSKRLLAEAGHAHIQAQAQVGSNLRNAEVVQAMGMLPAIMRRWEARHVQSLIKQSQASDRSGGLSNLSKGLRILAQSLILGLGALLVLEASITPGMMIAASIIMGRALAPIDQMIGSWKGFVGCRDAYRRLDALLRDVPAQTRRLSLPEPRGEVAVEALTLTPPGAAKPVLRELDFHIARGEHVGIIGPSAAGKTTLARALLGVWLPETGAVRLDGADLGHWNRDELGPHLGYLPQDIELFDGTVSQNIARFGEVDDAQVVAAAKKAGVHDMILRLPEGYETPIGAGNGSLSPGQRQRIGLARALYGKPALVVLDEPNANLDDAGERALAEALRQLKAEGTTLFVISHRRSVLAEVDKLLVLNEGRLRLLGARDEVLARLAAPGARRAKPGRPSLSRESRAELTAAEEGP
ncbi:type I secretion system permease/ATPase [Halomonas sp. MCCC 1A17488]|uniref:Type I secretion system permease/ATPase n=1 Tax=Billgrantia sulfidoxydans TaxID=2733484 RepID=A0ABX7W3X4_9GAMM|nr:MULTISPECIES: type I secretion system permease/ATPase [Halomonas]MCE8015880.1 type I secretion system permease/ATPase [Halomonas sp. MCCC 1A17488]MCG3239213.1 type I secretion system permease/ATPase [Halomonas sp. MCCC 1A17488]QPP50852.1 type I secretion system permease/ATPase [Halomonas sp. SS10-MC5]QTP54377.1 type I secretion system permease/ATPase [Halomonas sulfidoxydans]